MSTATQHRAIAIIGRPNTSPMADIAISTIEGRFSMCLSYSVQGSRLRNIAITSPMNISRKQNVPIAKTIARYANQTPRPPITTHAITGATA